MESLTFRQSVPFIATTKSFAMAHHVLGSSCDYSVCRQQCVTLCHPFHHSSFITLITFITGLSAASRAALRNVNCALLAQAKDPELVELATELRKRAERRLGEMMAAQPKAKGGQPYQSTGVSNTPVGNPGTLEQAGIDKNLAKRARKAAKMTDTQSRRS
jgi:hypothetical protein